MSVKIKQRRGQWEISNLYRKNSKVSAMFLTKTSRKKFGKQQHSTLLIWMVFYRSVQKFFPKLTVKTGLKKKALAFSKSKNLNIFRY